MYTIVSKLSDYLNLFVEKISIILVAVLTILTGWGVVARYLTGQPVIWLYETTVVSFAWSVFLGTTIAFKKKEHITLEFLANALPKKLKKYLMLFLAIIIIAFLLFVIKEGFQIVQRTLPQKYQTIDLSTAWFYASFPVSAIISVVHMVKECFDLVLNKVDLEAEKEINLQLMG